MTRGTRVGSKVDASPPRGDARRGSRFASRARRWRGRSEPSWLTPRSAGGCSPRLVPSRKDGGHERRPPRSKPGRIAPRRLLRTERRWPRSRVACPACVSPPRWRSGATRCRSVATFGRGKNWRCERFDEWRGASWRPRSTDSAPTARTPGVCASYSRVAARGGVTARRPPRLTRGGSKRKKTLERKTLRKAVHRMRTVRVARSFATWRDTWRDTRALARAWERCERAFKRRAVAKVRAALSAWYLFGAKARRLTLQRQADELMFLQGSLGSERHQKEKASQELHRARRETEGLVVLVERLQRETGVLLDQVAERDAQISRLLEERDRSSVATFDRRPHDRVSAVLASPPRRRKTPSRPPAAEPAPTSIEIREEPVAESPESAATPESPESPERSDSDEEDVTRELFPADDATPPPSRPSRTPPPPSPPRASDRRSSGGGGGEGTGTERTSKRTAQTSRSLLTSHPSHDPGHYASYAANWASGRRSTTVDDLSVRLFARVRPFVDGDVDVTRSLRPSRPGASDLDVVTRRGEVPFRETFRLTGGYFGRMTTTSYRRRPRRRG